LSFGQKARPQTEAQLVDAEYPIGHEFIFWIDSISFLVNDNSCKEDKGLEKICMNVF
jgi:hypothetical protein